MPTHSSKPAPPRVRIHLNLAKPELAECAVKVRSARGGWVTVGYSTHLQMENCIPVVDRERQRAISQGLGKKTPHAFIEGDLVAFKGRIRPVAPSGLVRQSGITRLPLPGSVEPDQASPINYNPRFAGCFYLDQPSRDQVNQRFEGCASLQVVGWRFLARSIASSPLQASDLCDPQALEKASKFEKQAIAAGIKTTRALMPGMAR